MAFRAALRPLTSTSKTIISPLARTFSSTPRPHDLARLTLLGRLTATPEPQSTASGTSLVRYTVAVSGLKSAKSTKEPETSFFNVTAFLGEGGEDSARAQFMTSLEKGTKVLVEADSRIATLAAREGEEYGRKVLDCVQRTFQIVSKPAPKAGQDDM